MALTKETPVLLLTGYLGSGKTTLLNHILTGSHGIRFAVIVNDIGEVNIDADLIQKGGVVGQNGGDDLVALQNGCICCTLRTDLMKQIAELIDSHKFDYIVIEASGVCEPEPIAQTICQMEQMLVQAPQVSRPRLDCIVTVVDALRMKSEFGCGGKLPSRDFGEEDIENLITQQIEFCNIILLNKKSEVTPDELAQIKAVLKVLNPGAEIIECDYCDVPLSTIVDTKMFNFAKVATSATWVKEIEKDVNPEEEEHDHHHHHHHDHEHDHEHEHEHDHDHEHEHDHEEHEAGCHTHEGGECTCHHHHHHHHGEGEAEEYGIGTFVYFRRRPFNFEKFEDFVAKEWPGNVIRTKGVMYFGQNRDMSLLFEQAGVQKSLKEAGYWFATAPEADLQEMMAQDPQLQRDWDDEYGDRMIKLVFIGRDLDRVALAAKLDSLLEES